MTGHEPRSDDDEEGDISDDPKSYAIYLGLEAIDKRNDIKLMVALFLCLAVIVLLMRLHIQNFWTNMMEVALVIAILGGTIYLSIRQKQNLATQHGLVCANCGYRPGPTMILGVATAQRCRKCGHRLNVTS